MLRSTQDILALIVKSSSDLSQPVHQSQQPRFSMSLTSQPIHASPSVSEYNTYTSNPSTPTPVWTTSSAQVVKPAVTTTTTREKPTAHVNTDAGRQVQVRHGNKWYDAEVVEEHIGCKTVRWLSSGETQVVQNSVIREPVMKNEKRTRNHSSDSKPSKTVVMEKAYALTPSDGDRTPLKAPLVNQAVPPTTAKPSSQLPSYLTLQSMRFVRGKIGKVVSVNDGVVRMEWCDKSDFTLRMSGQFEDVPIDEIDPADPPLQVYSEMLIPLMVVVDDDDFNK
eukprot:PhF_6_TR26454/c0_g1_i1/m.38310